MSKHMNNISRKVEQKLKEKNSLVLSILFKNNTERYIVEQEYKISGFYHGQLILPEKIVDFILKNKSSLSGIRKTNILLRTIHQTIDLINKTFKKGNFFIKKQEILNAYKNIQILIDMIPVTADSLKENLSDKEKEYYDKFYNEKYFIDQKRFVELKITKHKNSLENLKSRIQN